jgi:hypothetical protein
MSARYLRRHVYSPRDGLANDAGYTPLAAFDALVDWTPALTADVAEPLLAAMEND